MGSREDIREELTKFLREHTEPELHASEVEGASSGLMSFETFSENFRRSRMTKRSAQFRQTHRNASEQARLLMEIVESFRDEDPNKRFPSNMVELLETLAPTSVSAERAFSQARHCRRYNQEKLNDDRFCKKMFLRCYFAKNKPWRCLPTGPGNGKRSGAQERSKKRGETSRYNREQSMRMMFHLAIRGKFNSTVQTSNRIFRINSRAQGERSVGEVAKPSTSNTKRRRSASTHRDEGNAAPRWLPYICHIVVPLDFLYRRRFVKGDVLLYPSDSQIVARVCHPYWT